MATYTQMTPVPFWLMIVSIAIAVLPVPLSPMISSRCPRPMGIMESIALIPVWSGSLTGCRTMMPGASDSTLRACLALIGPAAAKIRGSTAGVGADADPYLLRTTYSGLSTKFNGLAQFTLQDVLANAELKPEI